MEIFGKVGYKDSQECLEKYPAQGRIQKISEGVAITIKKRFSKRIRGARTPLFSFLPRKNWKKFYEGVAVAGLPTAGSATDPALVCQETLHFLAAWSIDYKWKK